MGLTQKKLGHSTVVLLINLQPEVFGGLSARQYPGYPKIKIPPTNHTKELMGPYHQLNQLVSLPAMLEPPPKRTLYPTPRSSTVQALRTFKVTSRYFDHLIFLYFLYLKSRQTNDIVDARHGDSPGW